MDIAAFSIYFAVMVVFIAVNVATKSRIFGLLAGIVMLLLGIFAFQEGITIPVEQNTSTTFQQVNGRIDVLASILIIFSIYLIISNAYKLSLSRRD